MRYTIWILYLFPFLASAQELMISHANGYHGEFDLTITCDSCDEIRYNVNGESLDNAMVYSNGIRINKALVSKNRLALRPTTAIPNIGVEGVEWHTWKAPGTYEKAVSIKCAGYKQDNRITRIYYRTFFFDENWSSFPTISLNINPKDFYDDSIGISVPGRTVNPTNSIWTGNYHQKGKNWERQIHYTFLKNGKTKQDTDVGVRIHGLKAGAVPQKSLRLYARKKVGAKHIKYKFEKSKNKKHKRIILRTPYSGHSSKVLSDVITHEIARPLNIDIMDYGFARTFINGEYWGLHMVRERIDEKYLVSHYSCKEEDIQIPGNYDQPEFQRLFDFLDSNDLSTSAAYNKFGQLLDLENFIDYVIVETHFRNTDWLQDNNNVTFWKEKGVRKWRLILIDMDACYQKVDGDMIEFMKEHNQSMISRIFFPLMENEVFKQEFIRRYNQLVDSLLSPARCFHIIDSLSDIVHEEMAPHVARWGHPTSVFTYVKDLDQMRAFVNERGEYAGKHLAGHFSIDTAKIRTTEQVFFISQDEKIVFASILGLLGFLVFFLIRRKKRRSKVT